MNHSYKTCLLLFSSSFHSAVRSAAKFSRHSPSQHTSFQRSSPTYLRMPFTKRSSYLIQIRSTLRPPCRSQFTHCFCDFLDDTCSSSVRQAFHSRRTALTSESLASLRDACAAPTAEPYSSRKSWCRYPEKNSRRAGNSGVLFAARRFFLSLVIASPNRSSAHRTLRRPLAIQSPLAYTEQLLLRRAPGSPNWMA
jgi:hypothetical protein